MVVATGKYMEAERMVFETKAAGILLRFGCDSSSPSNFVSRQPASRAEAAVISTPTYANDAWDKQLLKD
jgi:hypothetical protein